MVVHYFSELFDEKLLNRIKTCHQNDTSKKYTIDRLMDICQFRFQKSIKSRTGVLECTLNSVQCANH